MKRIAIFCDGTWNRHDAANQTNVVRMSQSVKLTDETGDRPRTQQVFYLLGVGSGRGSNWAARALDKVAGGAFGWGLMENIVDAYRNLIFCYEPGDEIYIFGFSRGAYTARSLAGLIRFCGIPPRTNVHRIGEAIMRYRNRTKESRPDDPYHLLFRSGFSPFTATSETEYQWRIKARPGLCVKVNIAYMGVWDTVGAMGVPGFISFAPILNKSYQFHDTDLSHTVLSARHAVAIDERRLTFPPTLWGNLDRLNKQQLEVQPEETLADRPREDWPYRQEWFPGDHAAVGGGGDQLGLSSYAFDWIVEGAAKAGLCFDPAVVASFKEHANIRAPVQGKSKKGMMGKMLESLSKDREGPDVVTHVSDTTIARVKADPTYKPKPLDRVIDQVQRQIDPS